MDERTFKFRALLCVLGLTSPFPCRRKRQGGSKSCGFRGETCQLGGAHTTSGSHFLQRKILQKAPSVCLTTALQVHPLALGWPSWLSTTGLL